MKRWGVVLLLVLAARSPAQPAPPFVPLSVPQLLTNLRTGSEPMRREAAFQLSQFGQERSLIVPVLLDVLDDPDEVLRVIAALSLWRLDRHPRAVPTLVQLCRSGRNYVQFAALDILREIGPAAPEVVPMLVDMGRDTNPVVQNRAIEALGRCVVGVRDDVLIEKKVVPALIELLRAANTDLRSNSVVALGSIGPRAKEAVTELEALLVDPKARIRLAAADALWLIGQHPRSQSVLIELLANEDDTVRRSAVDALGWHGQAARQAVPAIRKLLGDPVDRVRVGTLVALRCIGEWDEATLKAVARTARQQDVRPSLRVEALRLLGGLAGRARPVKVQVRAAMRDNYSRVRAAAAEALWQIAADPDALLAIIERVGKKHQFLTVHAKPTPGDSLLLRLGPEALPALKALEPRVNEESQIALHKTIIRAGQQDVKLLTGYLEHEQPEVRTQAIEALSKLGAGARPAVGGVTARLLDEDESVRGAALFALWRLGPEAAPAVPVLCNLLADSPQGQQAAGVLERIGPGASTAIPRLRELLDRTTPMTRHAAVEALAFIGGPDVPAILIPLLDDENIFIRRLAAYGLRHCGPADKPAIPRLEAALKDRDPIVRALAAEALWNISRHPDSIPTLLAVIQDRSAGRDRFVAVRSLAAISPPPEVLLPALIAALGEEGPREEALPPLKALGTKARSAAPVLVRLIRTVPRGSAGLLVETLLAIDPDNEAIVSLAIEREFDVGLDELARRGPQAAAAVPALQRHMRDYFSHGKGFAAANPVLQRIKPKLFVPPPWQESERGEPGTPRDAEREPESEQSPWLIAILGAALGCCVVFRRPRQKGRMHAFSHSS